MKSKSNERKELAGTLVNHKKATPKPPSSLLESGGKHPTDPPDWLNPEGKEIYRRLIRHLQSVDSMWAIDFILVEQAAYWKSLHIQAIKDLKQAEMIQTFETGARQMSPEFQVVDKIDTRVLKYYDLLGIGPKAREDIAVFNTTGGSESEDPFTQLHKKFEAEPAQVIETK